ncbi:MAG: hypothetical protein LBV30_09390 [Propionibacteriaceae bacterium]|jgi:hypothetical protein|nr:hypothetical protein [Propionibacteriaceae bacterium]
MKQSRIALTEIPLSTPISQRPKHQRQNQVVASILAVGLAISALSACTGPNNSSTTDSYEDQIAQAMRDIWVSREQNIAECMAAAGFDYQPEPYSTPKDVSMAAMTPYTLTEEEAAAHGFGIIDALVASVEQNNTASQSPMESQSTDQSYQEALFGNDSVGGCREQGIAQANQELNLSDYPALANRSEIADKMQADPRMTAFWPTWSDCMADLGIIAEDQAALESDLTNRASQLLTITDPILDPETGMFTPSIQSLDPSRLDALRVEERADAAATVQCLEPLRSQWDAIWKDATS